MLDDTLRQLLSELFRLSQLVDELRRQVAALEDQLAAAQAAGAAAKDE